jgi:hypothetical protein
VRAVLCYGLSSLTLRETEYQRLEVYERQVLRKMYKGWQSVNLGGRTVWVPVANIKLYKDTGLTPLKKQICKRRWLLFLHISRRSEQHPCKKLKASIESSETYAEMSKKRGGQKLTFLRQLVAEAKKAGLASGMKTLWSKLARMNKREHFNAINPLVA